MPAVPRPGDAAPRPPVPEPGLVPDRRSGGDVRPADRELPLRECDAVRGPAAVDDLFHLQRLALQQLLPRRQCGEARIDRCGLLPGMGGDRSPREEEDDNSDDDRPETCDLTSHRGGSRSRRLRVAVPPSSWSPCSPPWRCTMWMIGFGAHVGHRPVPATLASAARCRRRRERRLRSRVRQRRQRRRLATQLSAKRCFGPVERPDLPLDLYGAHLRRRVRAELRRTQRREGPSDRCHRDREDEEESMCPFHAPEGRSGMASSGPRAPEALAKNRFRSRFPASASVRATWACSSSSNAFPPRCRARRGTAAIRAGM